MFIASKINEKDWGKIPVRMRKPIILYIEKGYIVDDFLAALISNDLKNTFFKADDENINLIFDYMKFFYNCVPSKCWGSKEKYENWISQHGLERY